MLCQHVTILERSMGIIFDLYIVHITGHEASVNILKEIWETIKAHT